MPLVTLHSRSSVGDLPGERRFDHLTTSRAVQVDLGDRGGRLRKPRHCADAVQLVGLHVRDDKTERGSVISESSDLVSLPHDTKRGSEAERQLDRQNSIANGSSQTCRRLGIFRIVSRVRSRRNTFEDGLITF